MQVLLLAGNYNRRTQGHVRYNGSMIDEMNDVVLCDSSSFNQPPLLVSDWKVQ
jgi:hypothetical protein